MSNITQSEVIAIIETALEIKSGLLNETTRSEEVENWDSLGQLSILVALDKLFDGKIANLTEMAEADSMPKILDILKQHSLI
jgi:acyl carrier protein